MQLRKKLKRKSLSQEVNGVWKQLIIQEKRYKLKKESSMLILLIKVTKIISQNLRY